MFCEVMAGIYIAFTFQVSHVNTNVSWPLPDKNGLVHIDWYIYPCFHHAYVYGLFHFHIQVGDASTDNTRLLNQLLVDDYPNRSVTFIFKLILIYLPWRCMHA